MQANAAVDRELRNEAFEDLISRVDDWKSHRADQFGDLLLHGHFPVVTGKSDVQKEVRTRPFYMLELQRFESWKEPLNSSYYFGSKYPLTSVNWIDWRFESLLTNNNLSPCITLPRILLHSIY